MSWLISSTDRCRAFVYNFGKLNSELVDFAAAKLSLSFYFKTEKNDGDVKKSKLLTKR